jgi:GNAT superfamily N-acetyltransferase
MPPPAQCRRALPIRGPLPMERPDGMLGKTKERYDDGGPAMTLATWWTTDPLPLVRPLPGFHAEPATDDGALAALNGIPIEEVQARRAAGHRPYVGLLDGAPVAYGWVATREASIGELGLTFRLPAEDRYLWDFATLPEWQGRGFYPRLLQTILIAESRTARRFWILHAPENTPSGAGMEKAGLVAVGRLSFRPDGGVALAVAGPVERARAGAALLGVELVEEVAPCWRCGADAGEEAVGCGNALPEGYAACTCAISLRPPVTRIA